LSATARCGARLYGSASAQRWRRRGRPQAGAAFGCRRLRRNWTLGTLRVLRGTGKDRAVSRPPTRPIGRYDFRANVARLASWTRGYVCTSVGGSGREEACLTLRATDGELAPRVELRIWLSDWAGSLSSTRATVGNQTARSRAGGL